MSCWGKVVVNIAENGHSYRLECNEYTLVESVQKFIESMSGIPFNDQLLFCLDSKLESSCQLSDYKLPSEEREVFLFNKATMRSTSPNPATEKVEFVNIPDDPPLPSSAHNPHPLDDASDPALKALPSFERQFIYHYQYGDAICGRTTTKFEACKRLLQEQQVQIRALEVARGNLNRLYKVVHKNYNTSFLRHYSRLHQKHTYLLENFGRNIEKLRSAELPPPLQSAQIKCLLDFVKEENLQKSWEECSISHKQYDNKVSVFNLDFVDLERSAEHILSVKTSILIEDLELSIEDHKCYINEQKSIMQDLSKDVNTVKKLVEDCLSSQMASSLHPHDAVSALDHVYDSHDKSYLPKMLSCERKISNLLDSCRDKKNEMNSFVHIFIQKIAHTQGTIKDLCCKFSVLQEALKQLSNQFEQLKVLREIGPAYRSCLAEVVKRREVKKIYMAKAERLVERLALERDAEVKRREEFLKVHRAYIPREVLASMGLFDIPNPCNAYIAPFDSNLLDIDFSGLEYYAPESLLRSPSKSKKHAISNDDSRADEVERTMKFPEKFDFLEGSELVEIGGVSKMEVENAKLKSELASKIALICSMSVELDYESLDDSTLDSVLRNATDKTTEALHLKDEYVKHLHLMLKTKQMECESYKRRIYELEHNQPRTTIDDNKLEVSAVGEEEQISTSIPLKYGITAELDDLQEGLDNKMMDLLPEKSSQLCNAETKIPELMNEISKLGMELAINRKLLDESQIKCAHLENSLHVCQEEIRKHLLDAEHWALEYSTLHLSSTKMHGFFESLRSCISSVALAAVPDSLYTLTQSLASESDNEDCSKILDCIQILADKVGHLLRQHAELLDRSSKAEDANELLFKELCEKELLNTFYLNHQIEKQAKELEVDDIALFILNSSGHYEATYPYHYLSDESVALFSSHPSYIVGQVTHIEGKSSSGSSSNLYSVPVGCEYFVVSIRSGGGASSSS